MFDSKTPPSSKQRVAIITLLIIALGSITFYFQIKGISTVFTHLYYVAIIIACVWWQRKAYTISMILGIMLISIHYFTSAAHSITEDLLRIGVMFIITFLTSELSVRERSLNTQCSIQNVDLGKAYAKLKDEEKQLNESNIKLKSKLEEIEKLYKITINRELAMAELKKKINN